MKIMLAACAKELLAEVWSYVGSARDNSEPIDANWVQARLLAIRGLIERLEVM